MANYVNYGSQSLGSQQSLSLRNDSMAMDGSLNRDALEEESLAQRTIVKQRQNSFGDDDNDNVSDDKCVIHSFLTRSNSSAASEQDVIDALMQKSPVKYNEIVVGGFVYLFNYNFYFYFNINQKFNS
jgi:hypothetical protein